MASRETPQSKRPSPNDSRANANNPTHGAMPGERSDAGGPKHPGTNPDRFSKEQRDRQKQQG